MPDRGKPRSRPVPTTAPHASPNPPARRVLSQSPILLAATLLVALSILDFQAWERELRRLVALAEEVGAATRHSDLERRMRRETDPVHAGLELASTLLVDELSVAPRSDASPAQLELDRARGIERLRLARRVGESAMTARPTAWRAALVVGGSTYLERFRSRDPRLFAESAAWEGPLLRARQLGPAYPEPMRFLAAAYLGNWAGLTPAKRDEATRVVAQAFEDEETLALLLESWLRVAPSLRHALSVLPARSWAWERMRTLFARQRDWERYGLARQRWIEALESDLQEALAEADLLSRLGDASRARLLYLDVLRRSPPDRRFAAIVRQVLERLPPGPLAPSNRSHLEAWLSWNLAICLLSECPLPAEAVERLSGLAGVLETHVQAEAALAARDLARAEMIERHAASLISDSWGPYYILKAKRLLAADQPQEAATSLSRVPYEWRKSPVYWLARREVAVAAAGDDLDEIDRRLEELERAFWPAFHWRWSHGVARLELLSRETSAALRVRIASAPPGGGTVELKWDGGSLGVFAVASGRTLTVSPALTAGLHRLELVPLEGTRVVPGEVELAPSGLRTRAPPPRPRAGPRR